MEDRAARQRGLHALVLLRVREEVEHLAQLLDRLVAAGDVGEARGRDGGIATRVPSLRLGATAPGISPSPLSGRVDP